MRIVVEEVTPNRARELLLRAHDQPQRHVRDAVVARIAHAIRQGQWKVTHQPIAIDPSGIVIDGQHRLSAVARADMTVEMLIAYDADPETFKVIDTGTARTAADTLAIAGYGSGPTQAAAARMYLTYKEIAGTRVAWGTAIKMFTTLDVLQLMESETGDRLMDALSYAQPIVSAWGRTGYRTWLSAALTAMAESDVPRDLQADFMARLQDGAQLGVGSPLLTVRRYVMSDTGLPRVPGSLRAPTGIACTLRALNSWLAGDSLYKLGYRSGLDRMPVVRWQAPTPPLADNPGPQRPQAVDLVRA